VRFSRSGCLADDALERKVDTEALGPMPMTRSARYSPFSLRGHPIVMVLMVFYHVADLAGVFAKRAH
jgi:hypothetical protein